MDHSIKLKLEILAPDDVLREHDQQYYSIERLILLDFMPFSGLWINIDPVIGDDEKSIARYHSLFQKVNNKPGIFEVERCSINVDRDGNIRKEAALVPKMESSFESFNAMKKYVEYFGFKKI